MVVSEIRDVSNELHWNTGIEINSCKLALEDAIDLSQDRLCSEWFIYSFIYLFVYLFICKSSFQCDIPCSEDSGHLACYAISATK
jgi:hypothetical protein